MRRFHRLVSRIVVIGSNDWSIHGLEAVGESLLSTQNISPRVSPCFGRVNDLTKGISIYISIFVARRLYLGEHFISFIKVVEQYSDLAFICSPWQEFAKSSLHALHFGGFDCWKTCFNLI